MTVSAALGAASVLLLIVSWFGAQNAWSGVAHSDGDLPDALVSALQVPFLLARLGFFGVVTAATLFIMSCAFRFFTKK
jgi:hypothetical protein